MTDNGYISLNGSLINSDEASVSPVNRGMMYGEGCFETLKSYNGRFLKWEEHFDRLKDGLAYLGMHSPIDSAELKKEVSDLLGKNNLSSEESMVRIQFWREGGRGYKSSSSKTFRMIQANSYTRSSEPLDLITAKTRCIPSEALERKYKLTNGLNYIKAAQEADRHQKDDAVMLTVNGFVSETTIANLFWMQDGIIHTPSEECDLLPGITRGSIISILQERGINIQIGKFEPKSIYEAEAAFCTNSLIEIREIRAVDDIQFKTGQKPFKEILELYEKYKQEELRK